MNEKLNRLVSSLHEQIEVGKKKQKIENITQQMDWNKYVKIIQFNKILDLIFTSHLHSRDVVSLILVYLDPHTSTCGLTCVCRQPDFHIACMCKCHQELPTIGCKKLICKQGCVICEECMTLNPCANEDCKHKLCKHGHSCKFCKKLLCANCSVISLCENPDPCFESICHNCQDNCGYCGNHLCTGCSFCNHEHGCPWSDWSDSDDSDDQ